MRLIKNKKNLVLVALSAITFFGSLLSLLSTPSTAYAEPNCYETNGNAVIKYECLSYSSFPFEIGNPLDKSPEKDKCYVKEWNGTSFGTAKEGDCNALRFADAVLPKCFIGKTLTSCDGAIAISKAAGKTLEIGKCYDVSNSLGTIPEVECNSVLPIGAIYGSDSPNCPVTVEGCPGYVKPRYATGDQAAFESCSNVDDCDFITKYINPLIKFVSAGIGLLVTIMIIIAGIQYSAAGADPQKVTAARKKIINALLALVTYIFFFALMQWLWPGGLI